MNNLLSQTITPANPSIRNQTLRRIHEIFLEAIYSSKTDLGFLKKFLELLTRESVPEEESRFWGIFVDGVQHCYQLRLHKQNFQRMAQNLALCIQKIVDWVNQSLPENEERIGFQIIVRQKSIFMHLMKVLKKSLKYDYEERIDSACIPDASACIHDFMGILGVIVNEYDTKKHEQHHHLGKVYKNINGIISGQDPKAKDAFLSWLDESKDDPSVKYIVHLILDTPFHPTRFKNYVKYPKPNGYRTLQWTFVQPPYSQNGAGSEVEVQIRDIAMHRHALETHRRYKDLLDKPEFGNLDPSVLANVFFIEDFDRVHIVGFSKYDKKILPINPDDVCISDSQEVTDIMGDTYGFAVPVVIETLTV